MRTLNFLVIPSEVEESVNVIRKIVRGSLHFGRDDKTQNDAARSS